MPRYRYKRATFTSPKLQDRVVVVQRLSDALAILKLLGDGSITLEAEESLDAGFRHRPEAVIPIRHLLGKNEEAIWKLFDGEIDVTRARVYRLKGRQVNPDDNGRWPCATQDIRNVLDGMLPDSIYRLRHFGALMITETRIGELLYGMGRHQRAAVDAGLSEIETIIAFHANATAGCRDLIYLK